MFGFYDRNLDGISAFNYTVKIRRNSMFEKQYESVNQ